MHIVECNSTNCEKLVAFVEEMFSSWLDKSSMSSKNTCCCSRTKEELISKIRGDQSVFYYAADGDRILGFMCTENDSEKNSMYVSYINVHPEERGKNVFRNLLDHASAVAAGRNNEFIRLDTWPGNENALKAFEKTGFIVEHSCSCTVKLYKKIGN